MVILEAKHIEYEVQGKELLNIEQVQIQQNDCIGVIGKNGSGKTSLLNILSGKIKPKSGIIVTEASRKLLPQLKRTDTTQSGGEVTQEYINQALAAKADLLFADEPTTNLDTVHIEKVEKQLKRVNGALVIVSHDRAFLDALCTKIWEVKDATVTEYLGNYSDYEEQRDLEIRQQQAAYEQYISKKKQLENALEQKKKKAARATKNPNKKSDSDSKQMGAKPYFAKKQKKLETTAKAIKTRIEKLEKVEKVKEEAPLNMDIVGAKTLKNRVILRVEEVEGRIGSRILWEKASFQIKAGDKLAIIGDNGTGKTTLIRKIISQEKGIQISPAVQIGYFSQNLDILDVDKTILENVMESSSQEMTLIRTVLARLHFFGDDVNKQVKVLSGGERVKVAFAKIFLSEINTLVLDEPTNFLDITAVEALESLLKQYEGTIILISHDRRFIQHIANRVLHIDSQEITIFDGQYEAYIQFEPNNRRDTKEEQLMVLETKISDVLSRLSIEPTPELDEEFKRLLQEKKKLELS
ncbi:ABC-F type ribosomal protection protein [Ornithinibacillus sp. L9]|uniref:ABC-F type ribosomal protection protein n=1 Tax=Ornithinibacillus caprae TaxID=2678566 RepID=A0A6N8FLQ3_9BACI|nr:ABC-F type ribosomal protection protein [Ornithinibacillus caprae]MUK90293.1 ABC-F type ribosomal protection protein [Ornithinibacillus caprae]